MPPAKVSLRMQLMMMAAQQMLVPSRPSPSDPTHVGRVSPVVAYRMLFCLRCSAPQTDDSAKAAQRHLENQCRCQRILATAAASTRKPVKGLIMANLRHLDQGSRKQAKMAAEAAVIRDAKDHVTRSTQLRCVFVAARWQKTTTE